MLGQPNHGAGPALVEELVAQLVPELDQANRALLSVAGLLPNAS